LRAATSLARLLRDQSRQAEARDLFAPVYGWFTEGFDTLDLQEAKALLEELAAYRSIGEHDQAASSVLLRPATMPFPVRGMR
jgi:predicted ATPase